jgi:hypothetical protein
MKFPENKTGISTSGALGITLVVLISTGFISSWWMILAVLCIFSGIGSESGK